MMWVAIFTIITGLIYGALSYEEGSGIIEIETWDDEDQEIEE